MKAFAHYFSELAKFGKTGDLRSMKKQKKAK
jgi:hypothetical protein